MSKSSEILKILQDYEIIKNDDSLLLNERLSAMCAAEEIADLFFNEQKARKYSVNVVKFKPKETK